jgi:ribosomal-protein-alanine N-acetyltransferase
MISSPSIFTLRNYQKRDFERLFKLDTLCFEPGIAYSRAELSSFIEQRRATTIVAEWNAAAENAAGNRPAIAGFVTFHLERQGYGHIITLDVHPEARRHGLGTLLMNAVFERLRKVAAFMVVLEVAVNNHAAIAFYEKLGFHRIRILEGYYSRNVDAILMNRRF